METKTIKQYEKGDAPTVAVGYMRGVILQDGSFNFNGHTMFISDTVADVNHVDATDLFVEVPSNG